MCCNQNQTSQQLLRVVSSCSPTAMSMKPFVLRWGIVGAGRISGFFVRDLVLDPAKSGREGDVVHAVAAIGSRSREKAEEFIKANCPQGGFAQQSGLLSTVPAALGSYADVYSHPVSTNLLGYSRNILNCSKRTLT